FAVGAGREKFNRPRYSKLNYSCGDMWSARCMNDQRILFEAPKLALTRVEAADALDVSPATLDRLVKRGLLRPSRALRRPLFSIAEIERFLRETTAAVGV